MSDRPNPDAAGGQPADPEAPAQHPPEPLVSPPSVSVPDAASDSSVESEASAEPEPLVSSSDAAPETVSDSSAQSVASAEASVEPESAASPPIGSAPETVSDSGAESVPEPAAQPSSEPIEPVAEPSDMAAPIAEPSDMPEPVAEPSTAQEVVAEPSPQEAVEAEPHTSVEAVAEPLAPAQIAPEPGEAPRFEAPQGDTPHFAAPDAASPSEPGAAPFEAGTAPSAPEPAAAPVEPEPGSEETLALPPTTKEVEPPPSEPSAPPPPTGVPVPFAAPPTERNGGRFALKLIFGIGGAGLLCIGVVVAIVAAFVVFANSVTDKVESTAEEFIGEVAAADWSDAYGMLCSDLRQRPLEDYVPIWESWDAESAEVGSVNPEGTGVEVRLSDGSTISLLISVDQSGEKLETDVCGWRDVHD